MKLDRNIEGNLGRGKYAILNLRKIAALEPDDRRPIESALSALQGAGVLEWGAVSSQDEFFLIKLKDRCAHAALRAYASEAATFDREWSDEVYELAGRAGPYHPLCKQPD